MGEEACSWDLKVHIRSVILDWRQRPAGHSSRPVTSPVCDPRLSHYFTKRVPRNRRKICANSLWLYSYFTQRSQSKNKNINYNLIYLRVFRCLSSGSIYETCMPYMRLVLQCCMTLCERTIEEMFPPHYMFIIPSNFWEGCKRCPLSIFGIPKWYCTSYFYVCQLFYGRVCIHAILRLF